MLSKEWPRPTLRLCTCSILWACLFGFVMQMGELATEKETGLRSYMRTVGMLDSAFWLSWMAWHTVQNFIMAFSLLLSGLILQVSVMLRVN